MEIFSHERAVGLWPESQPDCRQQNSVVNLRAIACRFGQASEQGWIRTYCAQTVSPGIVSGPCSQPLTREPHPIKPWAGIGFAPRCHIGMADDPRRRDIPSVHDTAPEGFQGRSSGDPQTGGLRDCPVRSRLIWSLHHHALPIPPARRARRVAPRPPTERSGRALKQDNAQTLQPADRTAAPAPHRRCSWRCNVSQSARAAAHHGAARNLAMGAA